MENQNNNMKSIVKIENFPSRIEIFDMLDKFLSEKNMGKDYTSDNKDNTISFTFKNSVIYYKINKVIRI
jgi:hypothetical protein